MKLKKLGKNYLTMQLVIRIIRKRNYFIFLIKKIEFFILYLSKKQQ
jgi:hypothetical protein